MWAAAEMSIPVTRLDVGGAFGGNDTEAFLAMNPMGRVPVLEHDGLVIFESQAILRYLGALFGAPALWPQDPVARAPVDQWMEWSKINVAPAVIYKVFWQLVRVDRDLRDHARLAEGIGELKMLMGIAERQIARHGWLAGPTFSLADIGFGTLLYRYFTLDFDRAGAGPALETYYRRLTERPAYVEHVMVPYDSLRHPNA